VESGREQGADVDFTILVKDAAGASVGGATVLVTASGAATQNVSDGQGKVVLSVLPTEPFTIDVQRASYIEEKVTFYPSAGDGSPIWDNPVCAVPTSNTIVVRLSRIRAAATMTMSNRDLESRSPFEPRAVFTWTDEGGNATRRYLGTYNDVQTSFVAVNHPLLPDKPTDGWGRINHEAKPVLVDPSRNGDLAWLEWGLSGNEPRLSVAIWMPRLRNMSPSQLDFVVFFSPNTATKDYPADVDKYPYWAQKGTAPLHDGGPLPLVQPYIGLAHRYMFFEKWLVQQVMASRRQIVIVFPVQPYGDWGPFGELAGIGRLLNEIAHFMHRTGYDAGGVSRSDQDQAPSPNYRFSRLGIQAPIPTLRRVALAGFSAGMAPVVAMLGAQIGQRLAARGFTHELFGADVASILDVWKEVWDHDAPATVRGTMDQSMPAWLKANSDRMARCYQSAWTGSQGWIDATPLGEFVSGPPPKRGPNAAAERHDEGRCSLVYFPQGYLAHASTQPQLPPAFWLAKDDHQAVPMVTFGHAARVSGFKKS